MATGTQFPVFGTIASNRIRPISDTYKDHGFLSTEADQLRLSRKQVSNTLLERVKEAVRSSHADVLILSDTPLDPSEWSALTFWLRSLEACQGAALLADYGMSGSAVATLRTGLECLFMAAAIWCDPTTKTLLQNTTHQELHKYVKGHLRSYANDEIPAEIRQLMAPFEEKPSGPTLSVFDAAKRAGMREAYESVYRGLSNLGAHATERSRYQFAPKDLGNGRHLIVSGPSFEGADHIFTGVDETLRIGRDRMRDHFSAQFAVAASIQAQRT